MRTHRFFREGAFAERFAAPLLAAAVAGSVLAGCSYRGDIDNPATIKATWFSYLNGDDIRSTCVEGAPLHYRLIYNADYDKQVRSYEVIGDTSGGGAQLTVRVAGESGLDVTKLRFDDPLAFARWTRSDAPLGASVVERLDRELEASGAFAPAPEGLQLFSKETYWISNLCRDGVYSFNAWRYPSERFDAIRFDDLLFALDETGVAVREPVAVPLGTAARLRSPQGRQAEDATGNFFNVKVGDNGLIGNLAL
ncbi:hypothetical protein [Pelagibius sp. 7325]|uniref:hypothetical protein n=1 Tax=Pelagibius sp. 7325 TaxID=3131994 RepID=UPI0030ED9FAC